MTFINPLEDHFVYNPHKKENNLEVTHGGRIYVVTANEQFFKLKKSFFESIFSIKDFQKVAVTIKDEDKRSETVGYVFVKNFPPLEKIKREASFHHEIPALIKNESTKDYVKRVETARSLEPMLKIDDLEKNKPSKEYLTKVFYDQLTTQYIDQYKNLFLDSKQAIVFFGQAFEEAIQEAEGAQSFSTLLNEKLERTSFEQSIDKETFKQIAGDRVKGGIGKPSSDINLSNKQIKQLIQDYNSGSWKEDEERIMTFNFITKEELKKTLPLVISILEDPRFKNALEELFKD